MGRFDEDNSDKKPEGKPAKSDPAPVTVTETKPAVPGPAVATNVIVTGPHENGTITIASTPALPSPQPTKDIPLVLTGVELQLSTTRRIEQDSYFRFASSIKLQFNIQEGSTEAEQDALIRKAKNRMWDEIENDTSEEIRRRLEIAKRNRLSPIRKD